MDAVKRLWHRFVEWFGVQALWVKMVIILVALSVVIGPWIQTNDEPTAAPTTTAAAATTTAATTPPQETTSTTAGATTTTRATTTTASQFTRSEENAIRKAEDYLSFSAFSRSGLIDQLEFEGFTTAEATFGVDYLDVDWNEQAWMKAEDYLSLSAFSRSGLIDQLEFEGFTTAQATYGVDKAGL